jgi:hypothetical protein
VQCTPYNFSGLIKDEKTRRCWIYYGRGRWKRQEKKYGASLDKVRDKHISYCVLRILRRCSGKVKANYPRSFLQKQKRGLKVAKDVKYPLECMKNPAACCNAR